MNNRRDPLRVDSSIRMPVDKRAQAIYYEKDLNIYRDR